MNEIIEVMLCCRLFSGLTTEELSGLLERVDYQLVDYSRGDYLMREDSPYPYMSVILSGTIEIHRVLESGNNLCIELRERGEVFGGAVAFAEEGKKAECDIIARTKTQVLRIPRADVYEILAYYPRVNQNITRLFSERVLSFQQRLELLSYSSIRKKIFYYCRNILRPDEDGSLRLSLSKSKWAEYMNVSRPSLMRELRVLENEQLLSIEKDGLLVINSE
ncbi:MAG: Crp/Fnr family transcriptional regulator [Spirochaetales bacterium]|nr:Crp/Fnr family transcriptional regulator [Spirochaetales bacterium]